MLKKSWKWALALAGCVGMSPAAYAHPPLRVIATEETEPARAELPAYWIGISLREAQPALLDLLGIEQGVVVDSVAPNSPAEKAGLQRHDVIIKANDSPVAQGTDLLQAVGEAKDSEITLTVLRKGKEQAIKVTPVKRPEDRTAAPPGPVEGTPQEALERAMRLWRDRAGGGPLQLDLIGPAVTMRTAPPVLPDGVRITVEREGKNPAKITVKRGDESWTVSEKEIEKLPKDLREHARAMAGLPLEHPFGFSGANERPRLPPPEMRIRDLREDPLSRIEGELRQLRKEVEELRKGVEQKP
jgi:membrane-associated protease RseP (regulator of RpoE activity)